jgi:N-acylneuraminate cytidylyltransferase
MNILGLVPARGGSKGLPRKNILPLAGRPLLAHSIDHGVKSKYVNKIVCTTDDQEIADIARKHGAEVPFIRPAELATDDQDDSGFTTHAIQWLIDNEGWCADMVILLRPTSPIRDIKHIDAALKMLYDNPDAHSIVSIVLAEKTPYKMFRQSTSKFLKPLIEHDQWEQMNSARQIYPATFILNGIIHAMWANVAIRDNSTLGYKVLPYDMGKEPMLDIDSLDDFEKIATLINDSGN